MKETVVLVGAGSAMFTRGLVADLIRRNWEGELRLVDIDPEALAVAEKLSAKMLSAGKSPLKLRASVERRDVLKGASAVICTIGVGGRRAWEQDVFIPRRYGIYQPVGDSVMPGGTSRALRMIPSMVGVARDVLDLAPAALFFNYGNPMGPVCRAVRKATGAGVVGLCHGVIHVARYLADVLGVPAGELDYTAVGMNHLTWFTELKSKGHDLMPLLQEKAQQRIGVVDFARLGQSFAEAGTLRRDQPAAQGEDPFTWELVQLFGAFPAVMDRHVSEFFPHLFPGKGSYYGRTLGVDAYSFEGTIEYGDKIYAEMTELANAPGPLPKDFFERIGGEHEQVIEIVEAIRRGTGARYSVNLPNRGQAPNLPAEAIVESPAVAERGGLRPLPLPPMPSGLAGTLATRFQWVETVVEAALEGDRRKAVQALLLDGAVTSVDMAARLANDLLAVHRQYLPQFR